MSGYTRVWCLFCKTGRERSVVEQIDRRGWGTALFGEKVKVIHKPYAPDEKQVLPLLPSYVFVYLDDARLERPMLRSDYLSLDGVIRVLTYGETRENDLIGSDLAFAEWLWQTHGRVDVMKAVQLGQRVEINDPLFASLKGTIVRMDRRKKSVTVKVASESGEKFVTLSYEVVREYQGENN